MTDNPKADPKPEEIAERYREAYLIAKQRRRRCFTKPEPERQDN